MSPPGGLDPALLRIIEALARVLEENDHRAAEAARSVEA